MQIQWANGEGGVEISEHIDISRDFRVRFPLSKRRGGEGVRIMAGTMTKAPRPIRSAAGHPVGMPVVTRDHPSEVLTYMLPL
jgi:hypothetical protein